MILDNFTTIASVLQYRGIHQADELACLFIGANQKEDEITFGALHSRAESIAAVLQKKIRPSDRVLLLYQPGIEYIASFFGCLYAGVIPVPAYPPDSRNLKRLVAIMKDAQAVYALSTSKIVDYVNNLSNNSISNEVRKQSVAFLETITWIPTDTILTEKENAYQQIERMAEDIVFLQYTSGSTGNPKGVMLTNENVMNNLSVTKKSFSYEADTYTVSWLPPYHDMGLIGGILQPIYSGTGFTAMAPMTFVKNPSLWLEAISKQKNKGGVISGAPDFAYELCIRKIDTEKLAALDLSNWKVAFSGSEPVKKETLTNFYEKFASTGFTMESFFPVYGLAEATLLVSSGAVQTLPKTIHLDKTTYENHSVQIAKTNDPETSMTFVCCGSKQEGHEVRIVNVERETVSPIHEIGEIWLKSASIAKGYWNKEALTETAFNAYTKDTNEGPFFRTGDMGFMMDNQLYISGRLKDMMIIRGKNHYPQDIETAVQSAHESLRSGCGAAFSIDSNGEEKLIITQEVKREFMRKIDPEQIKQLINSSVLSAYGVQAMDIVLTKPSALPKTSSGKLQRKAAKEMYLNNQLTTTVN